MWLSPTLVCRSWPNDIKAKKQKAKSKKQKAKSKKQKAESRKQKNCHKKKMKKREEEDEEEEAKKSSPLEHLDLETERSRECKMTMARTEKQKAESTPF